MKQRIINFFKGFINSFKFRAEHFYVLLLDICYYLLSFLGIVLYSDFLQRWSKELGSIDVGNLVALPSERLAEITAAFSKFWAAFLVYSALLIIFLILMYGIFKSIIWSTVIKKRVKIVFMPKFLLLNFVWAIAVILILDIIALITGSGTFGGFNFLTPIHVILRFNLLHPIASIITALVLLHTTAVLQIYFTRDGLKGIRHAFLSFKKIHIFLLNYLLAVIPLAVVFILGFLLQFLPDSVNMALSAVLIVAFITWVRFYLAEVIDKNKI